MLGALFRCSTSTLSLNFFKFQLYYSFQSTTINQSNSTFSKARIISLFSFSFSFYVFLCVCIMLNNQSAYRTSVFSYLFCFLLLTFIHILVILYFEIVVCCFDSSQHVIFIVSLIFRYLIVIWMDHNTYLFSHQFLYERKLKSALKYYFNVKDYFN